MSSIITYLLVYNQHLLNQIYELTLFIAKHIPIKQWAFEDSNSPLYQKFKVDKLPIIKKFIKLDYSFLLDYYLWKYGKPVKPVQRRNGKTIPESTLCPYCGAPHHYIYDNNGGKGQYQCKVCGQTAQQFKIEKGWKFDITQVIGLTNDDPTTKEYRPFKQKIERLNRTFKATYRVTCGYGADDGAYYGVSLWVAYYNFLCPHELYKWKRPLNEVDMLKDAGNMPGKWQLLIFLGQQVILNTQGTNQP